MDEFRDIETAHTNEEFERLSKFVAAQTDDWRERYATTFPIRIWMVAGMSEEHSFAISVN